MHKSLKALALAGSAMALSMTPALVSAQEQMPGQTPDQSAPEQTSPGQTNDGMPQTTSPSMPDTRPSTEQQWDENTTTTDPASPATSAPPASEQDAMMKAWPADRQAGFKAWPAETQSYFWSLSKERQDIFWALSDSDKVTLSQMPEAQRESTWAQIESRVTPPRG